jgi:hypothetical protein
MAGEIPGSNLMLRLARQRAAFSEELDQIIALSKYEDYSHTTKTSTTTRV